MGGYETTMNKIAPTGAPFEHQVVLHKNDRRKRRHAGNSKSSGRWGGSKKGRKGDFEIELNSIEIDSEMKQQETLACESTPNENQGEEERILARDLKAASESL